MSRRLNPRPTRHVDKQAFVAALLALTLGACAHTPGPRTDVSAARPRATTPSAGPAKSTPADALPSLDDIAARGPSLAPGMRAVARKESFLERDLRVDAVSANDRDVCARVLFVASAPVTARLENAAGDVLSTTDAPSESGALGARGPVCIKKSDTIRLAFAAAPVRVLVRWVAWASP